MAFNLLPKKTRLSFIFLLFIFPLVQGQDTDRSLWTSIEIKKKLNTRFNVSLEQEMRHDFTSHSLNRLMTTLDATYKVTDFVKGSASYGLIQKYDKGDANPWETRHRFSFTLSGDYEWNRFECSIREKFQTTIRGGIESDAHTANPAHVLRTRFAVTYNIRKFPIDPFVSIELHHALNEPDGDLTPGNVFKYTERRINAGLEIKLNKQWSLKLAYVNGLSEEWDDFHIDNIRLGRYELSTRHAAVVGLSYTL